MQRRGSGGPKWLLGRAGAHRGYIQCDCDCDCDCDGDCDCDCDCDCDGDGVCDCDCDCDCDCVQVTGNARHSNGATIPHLNFCLTSERLRPLWDFARREEEEEEEEEGGSSTL
eukprot:8536101-Pyramimonas_sp.AAC.1